MAATLNATADDRTFAKKLKVECLKVNEELHRLQETTKLVCPNRTDQLAQKSASSQIQRRESTVEETSNLVDKATVTARLTTKEFLKGLNKFSNQLVRMEDILRRFFNQEALFQVQTLTDETF